MGNLLAELKRRHLYRVAAAYAVVAWVLLQLANNVAAALRIPDWGLSLILVLLLVGFPIALLFAWIHQLAPEEGALSHVTTGRLDWLLIGSLFVVIALVSYQHFAPSFSAGTAQQAGVVTARQASLTPSGAISIAVLPFVNLSSDKEQEFFSDGMTEEITSALAKVPNLRVVGRTSAFQFKGENKDLRAIGVALSATHLIEGSVRKDGNEVRITAQLIKADDGTHLWTESYNRELKGIFAMQEDIAQAIAGALRVPLGLKPGENLITSRIADPQIYEQYLQLRSRDSPGKVAAFEAFVARTPGFAPGWSSLAAAYRAEAANAVRRGDFKAAALFTDKEEAAARKAIQLDASYPGGYSELAAVYTRRGKWAQAEDLYKQVLSVDPNDSAFLSVYSQTLFGAGRFKEALVLRERLHRLEPLVPGYDRVTARIMLANGQTDAAIAVLEPDLSNGLQRNVYLAEAYAIKGRFADAADTLLRITTDIDRRSVEDAARLLRSAPSKTDQSVKLPNLVADLGFVYAFIGAPERMLEYPEQGMKEGSLLVATIWRPTTAPLRKTERFKALVRNVGLVDFWRARGWPDLCRPVGADDFVCD